MRRILLTAVLLAAAPAVANAQASQFGVRGLGIPGRAISTRTFGSGGAFGMFDPESSINPVSLAEVKLLTATFNGLQDFRHEETPSGTASLRESRFPQVVVVGPLRRVPAALGVSFSNYTSRDFSLASSATIDLRGSPVVVTDTFSSRGGLSDLRFAGAYRAGDKWVFGGSVHIITGSTRLSLVRSFADSNFLAERQRAEVSYTGVGVDLGIMRKFGQRFSVAGLIRSDGHARLDLDSVRVARVDLPYAFGLAARWRVGSKLDLAGEAVVRTWSAANSDVLEQGGVGAENTLALAFGGEFTPNPRRPTRRPLRFGVRYGTLPFPLQAGQQAHEVGVSVGTGLRFAQQRAGVDLGLEQVWRSGGDFSERAFLVAIGVRIQP